MTMHYINKPDQQAQVLSTEQFDTEQFDTACVFNDISTVTKHINHMNFAQLESGFAKACNFGNYDILKLIEKSTDITKFNLQKCICGAAHQGYTTIVRYLYTKFDCKGVYFNAPTKYNMECVHYMVTHNMIKDESMNFIADYGTFAIPEIFDEHLINAFIRRNVNMKDLMERAVHSRNINLIKLLISKGVPTDFIKQVTNPLLKYKIVKLKAQITSCPKSQTLSATEDIPDDKVFCKDEAYRSKLNKTVEQSLLDIVLNPEKIRSEREAHIDYDILRLLSKRHTPLTYNGMKSAFHCDDPKVITILFEYYPNLSMWVNHFYDLVKESGYLPSVKPVNTLINLSKLIDLRQNDDELAYTINNLGEAHRACEWLGALIKISYTNPGIINEFTYEDIKSIGNTSLYGNWLKFKNAPLPKHDADLKDYYYNL